MYKSDLIKIIAIILSLMGFSLGHGQTPAVFVDKSDELPTIFSSDYSLIVADINGDYRDDIVRQSEIAWLFDLQLEGGQGFLPTAPIDKTFTSLSCNIIDINKDFIPEIVMSGNKTGINIFSLDSEYLKYEKSYFIDSENYTQGSAVSDIDGDGDLDVFLTNDNGPNKIFIQNEFSDLVESSMPGIDVLNGEDAEGNYNVIFFDPDLDGDQDIYVSKCHLEATQLDDPRRINLFFENINGSYEEKGELWNLAQADQSWCTDAGDLDNDGDPDILLINHGSPILLLENDGDEFIEHSAFSTAGELVGDEQQVILGDFNNDGLLDIFIFGFNDQLLLNKGNLQFEPYFNPIGGGNAYSGACGDLNSDGWLDIYAVYGTAGSGVNDKMWLNFGGANNYIKFSLNGLQSNSLGVGARVEIYGDWGRQVRWIQSGSSYGITNSLCSHFGLGAHNNIDSLQVHWPSGIVDSYSDLEVNMHYVVTESSCISELSMSINDSYTIGCEDLSLMIETNNQGEYQWNNTELSDHFVVDTAGFYYGVKQGACRNATGIFYVDSLRQLTPLSLVNPGQVLLCAQDSFTLAIKNGQTYRWLDESTGNKKILTEEGVYFAYDTNGCDTVYSDTLTLNYLEFPELSDLELSTRQRSDLIISSDYANTTWYTSEEEFISMGETLTLDTLIGDTVFYFNLYADNDIPLFTAGPTFPNGDIITHGPDKSLDFKMILEQDFSIESFDVHVSTPGERRIIILNENRELVSSIELDALPGLNKLNWSVDLNAGEYVIKTDTFVSNQEFGHVSPGFSSQTSDTLDISEEYYPGFSLMNTIEGEEHLYYYNWVLKPRYEQCESDLFKYEIFIDTTVSISAVPEEDLIVFPNPADEVIWIKFEGKIDGAELLDVFGRTVTRFRSIRSHFSLDRQNIQSGQYLLRLFTKGQVYDQWIILK